MNSECNTAISEAISARDQLTTCFYHAYNKCETDQDFEAFKTKFAFFEEMFKAMNKVFTKFNVKGDGSGYSIDIIKNKK